MKKHHTITIVLSVINLLVALYIWAECQMNNMGIDSRVKRMSQAQISAIRLKDDIHDGFCIFLLILSVAALIGIAVRGNWGRILALLQCILFVVFSVYLLWGMFNYFSFWDVPLSFVFAIQDFWWGLFLIGGSVAQWIYLTRPNVKAIFKPSNDQVGNQG